MTDLVLGGLKFKSDVVFGQLKPTNIEKVMGLLVDTCKYTKSFGDSIGNLLADGGICREKSKQFQYIRQVFATESDPMYKGSSEVLALPIIRGLKVAVFYQLMEDKSTGDMYKLSHVSVKDTELLNAMGVKSLDITDNILKWVRFFKGTSTNTIPEYIPKYTLTEYGFPIVRDEDDVDSKAASILRIDTILTIKAIDCLESGYKVESLVRGWISQLDYMVHNKLPKMDAVVVGVYTNTGYLSNEYTLKSTEIEKSSNYIISTKRSLLNRLCMVGFISPFVDTTDSRFSFGSNLYTNMHSVNSMLTSLNYTNRTLRNLRKHRDIVGFIKKCKEDSRLTESFPVYLKNYKYQVMGISLSANYIIIDRKIRELGHKDVIMIRPHSALEEFRIEVPKVLGLNYEKYKRFIKRTGYNGTRNVMSRKTLKSLEVDNIILNPKSIQLFEEIQKTVRDSLKRNLDMSHFIQDPYSEVQ